MFKFRTKDRLVHEQVCFCFVALLRTVSVKQVKIHHFWLISYDINLKGYLTDMLDNNNKKWMMIFSINLIGGGSSGLHCWRHGSTDSHKPERKFYDQHCYLQKNIAKLSLSPISTKLGGV
jgi:hypothetical protein